MPSIKLKHNTISAKEALLAGIRELQAAHIETASLDARLLLEHVLQLTREELLLGAEKMLSPEEEALYHGLVAQRVAHKPVAQLIGRREFWGMEFRVTSATLDPRPDSETLVEAVLEHIKNRAAAIRLLDLGTGSGCLLLALLKELPAAHGVGVDKSAEALKIARENADMLGLSGRAAFVQSNWWEKVEGMFDIIISNPPYIPSDTIPTLAPEVCRWEPMLALDGGPDGLDCYRAIMPELKHRLKSGGLAAFE